MGVFSSGDAISLCGFVSSEGLRETSKVLFNKRPHCNNSLICASVGDGWTNSSMLLVRQKKKREKANVALCIQMPYAKTINRWTSVQQPQIP